jgi:hypothetical protein
MPLSSYRQKKNKEKPFAALELEIVNSEAWTYLNSTEAWVYIVLKTFYKGAKRNFKAPFKEIKKRSRIKHGETIDKAIKGLEDRGWIRVARYAKHGKCRGLRVRPNEYELTFHWDIQRW